MEQTKPDAEICGCTGCKNVATHTWSGHPTCDECATPARKKSAMPKPKFEIYAQSDYYNDIYFLRVNRYSDIVDKQILGTAQDVRDLRDALNEAVDKLDHYCGVSK